MAPLTWGRRSVRRRSRRPTLSVVVPIYHVEEYLDACVRSLLAQQVALEVVLVDDGSPDGSGRIADRWARRDPRVRVLHQDNAGLGAARNAGVRVATGPYVTFCDSDDVLPDGAYALLLDSITRSGSDVVIGALERFDDAGRSMGPLMRRNHQVSRSRVDVRDEPLLLADVFAVNKVFSRSFWQDAGLAFPEGVRYEDQPALTRALLSARSIDVLSDVVYLWRVREDGSSITQRRHELPDLADRVLTKRWSAESVEVHGTPGVREVFYREVLPIDMWEYFRAALAADEAYWEMLVGAVNELWHPGTVPFEQTAVPAQQRLMGWLTGQGRREDLRRWIEQLDAQGGPQFRDGLLVHPWEAEVELPRG